MKQCPVCHDTFDDQKAFCDMDGAALVDQSGSVPVASSGNTSLWVTGVIGGLIGVVVCVLLYLLLLAPGRQNALDEQRAAESKQATTVTARQVAVVPANNQVVAPSPSPEATESPAEAAPSPSPATAAVATPPPAVLNKGPIATSAKPVKDTEHAIIKMKDGSTIEADAAWEDAQGVWYRRSNVIAFIDKSRVEAITEQRKPAPTESKTP